MDFLQYNNNHFRQLCFQSETEVKEMFLFTIYKIFFRITMSTRMGRGSNKVLSKEALAQGQNLIYFTKCF